MFCMLLGGLWSVGGLHGLGCPPFQLLNFVKRLLHVAIFSICHRGIKDSLRVPLPCALGGKFMWCA